MSRANQRKQLVLKFVRETPYFLMVEADRESDAALAVALGRSPDNYAPYQGHIVATFHYASFADMIDAVHKVPADRFGTISDARVQFALLPTVTNQAEQRAARDLTLKNRARFSPPFIVSARYPHSDFDAVEVVGRAPFLVLGGMAVFKYDDFDEAVAACMRLAIADGTYGELQNSEVN